MELPAPQGHLLVERLVFVPPGADAPTLRSVSFSLMPGEVLGLIGPSAAGKTTLARCLTGAWRPAAGHVRLDGADISIWHAADGGRHIGYLPQDVELFSGRVRDNIARLGHPDPKAVIDAAKLAGLHSMIMQLPKGYDTDIGEGGMKLSGGQRQRIGLARALFGNPCLLVLDEPNSSLDAEGEAALIEAISQMKARGAAIVVIAHRRSILERADKILVLQEGSIAAFGTRAEILPKLGAPPAPGSGYEVPQQRPAEVAQRPAEMAQRPTAVVKVKGPKGQHVSW